MRRYESDLHVRGGSEFVDDISPPAGMLYAAVLGSPIAHGRLKQLDIDQAIQAQGVVKIITIHDIPGAPYFGTVIQDEPLLVDKSIMYQGQPICLVVADTLVHANQAAKLIEVSIDPAPVITCPKQAYHLGSVFESPRLYEKGAVDTAFDHCEYIVNGQVELGGQEHLYFETQRARAIPMEDGQIKLLTSTQSPSSVQRQVASVLAMPMHKIEVDVKRIGGGFGGKEDQANSWACMAALVAYCTGSPVQLQLSRHQDIKMTGKRHPYKQDYKLGFNRDGKILAYEIHHYQNSGAYTDLSPAVLDRSCFHSSNAYSIPNLRIFAHLCQTHLPPNTAFRGFGAPQGMFPLEAAIYHAANVLNVEPEWLQQKNLLKADYTFHYGQRYGIESIRQSWDQLTEQVGLEQKKREIDQFNQNNPGIKKAYALMPVCFGIGFTKSFLNQGNALVQVYGDGSVNIASGAVEMGQGVSANLISIVAEIFGIGTERIRHNSVNTSRVVNLSPSAASFTTDLNGSAVKKSCLQILTNLKQTAAEQLSAEVSEISIQDELVCCRGERTDLDWSTLVQNTYMSRKSLMAYGYFTPPNIQFDTETRKGQPFSYYTCGTAMIEVSVDCLMGEFNIEAVSIVHDIGRPLADGIDRGQIEGAIVQGLGWMTLEQLSYDEQGKLLNDRLSRYKIPDVNFMPDCLQIDFLPDSDTQGVSLGRKAVGEPPLMYAIAVYFALRKAVDAFHRQQGNDTMNTELQFSTPFNNEQLLMALYPELEKEFTAK